MRMLGLYILGIYALSVFVTVWDKMAAQRRAWRVPESVLLLLAALGGSLAMLVTMLIIRHKTKHPKFMFGIPVIMALHIALILFYIWRWAEMHT